jgi:hypothetical protein
MKYVIVIDGVESTRYTYNVWSVAAEYEDGTIAPDCREFASDDKDEFIRFISDLTKNDVLLPTQSP